MVEGDRALRVLIAEDAFIAREGTRRLLAEQPGVEVVGTAADYDQVLRAAAQLAPDAVLMDVKMPPSYAMEGIEAAHALKRDRPELGVVVLSQHDDEEYVWALLEGGVAGSLVVLFEDGISSAEPAVVAASGHAQSLGLVANIEASTFRSLEPLALLGDLGLALLALAAVRAGAARWAGLATAVGAFAEGAGFAIGSRPVVIAGFAALFAGLAAITTHASADQEGEPSIRAAVSQGA